MADPLDTPSRHLNKARDASKLLILCRNDFKKNPDHGTAVAVQRARRSVEALSSEMRARYIRLVWENPMK